MRKILLSLCALFFLLNVAASANQLTVKVESEGKPLSFSYVFINGKPYGSVNKAGFTYIPKNMLNAGDSISATFVGMHPGYVKYSATSDEKETVTIVLSENNLIEKVRVTEDPWKLYKKFVKNWDVDYEYLMYSADVTFRWGDLYMRGRILSRMHQMVYFEIDEPQYNRLDSAGIEFVKQSILQHIDRIYCNSYRIHYAGTGMLQHVRESEKYKFLNETEKSGYRLVYHGEFDNRRVFTQVWPESHSRAMFIGKQDKNIEKIFTNIFYGGERGLQDMMDVSYKITGRRLLAPESIDANIIADGEVVAVLHMSDIRSVTQEEIQKNMKTKKYYIFTDDRRDILKYDCMINRYMRTGDFKW